MAPMILAKEALLIDLKPLQINSCSFVDGNWSRNASDLLTQSTTPHTDVKTDENETPWFSMMSRGDPPAKKRSAMLNLIFVLIKYVLFPGDLFPPSFGKKCFFKSDSRGWCVDDKTLLYAYDKHGESCVVPEE